MKEFGKHQGLKFADDEAALDLNSFPQLLELVGRLIVRRNHLNDAIRLIDIATYYNASRQSYPHSPRWVLEPYTQKLSLDILELFVRSNRLDTGFLRLLNFPASAPARGPQPGSETANGSSMGEDQTVAIAVSETDEGASSAPVDSKSLSSQGEALTSEGI
jgi:hypothetical protein